jgi:general secretion pathway protein E
VSAGIEVEGAVWQIDFSRWPAAQATRWRAVFARTEGGALALMADRPLDRLLVQAVEAQMHAPVRWVQRAGAELDQWIEEGSFEYRALAEADAEPVAPTSEDLTYEIVMHTLDDHSSAVVRLLDAVLHDALQEGVSDVHIERDPRGARVRFRIDGVMESVRGIEGQVMAERVVSRLKVMAELDIGERRLPQDGRFRLRIRGRAVDLRLSIMPTTFGEDAVIRVLDRMSGGAVQQGLTLDALGFDAATSQELRALARLPHGMLLVTGPTGSGKTTTLYATLAEINTGKEKIITIEDPVEMQLAGVVQIPVNERKGLDFARGLRSILRHDPDRVMVGEIRDTETAQIAVQAALTGHLVFSTVHANNAFDVIGRFLHMGLDPYHVVSSLNAVLAQRLMRINCPQCSVRHAPAPALLKSVGLSAEGHNFMRGVGCNYCRSSGYRGRRAVSELLKLDDELRDLIASRAPIARVKALAKSRGMTTLRESALSWVCHGLTTFDELTRVTLAE